MCTSYALEVCDLLFELAQGKEEMWIQTGWSSRVLCGLREITYPLWLKQLSGKWKGQGSSAFWVLVSLAGRLGVACSVVRGQAAWCFEPVPIV